ncbi:MAG: VCBS repeat-containing protein [Pirellulaceae bacterium]
MSQTPFVRFLLLGICTSVTIFFLPSTGLAQEPAQSWSVKPLALDANEGCALGDIDGNGSLDIVAGRNWFPAPDFVPRPLRMIEDWNGYLHSNGDFLFDVNGDGRLDVISCSFVQTEILWYENPRDEALRLGHLWAKHLLVDTKLSENEAQLFTDIDADGIPEWVVNSWNPKNPLMVWRLEKATTDLPGKAKYRMVPAKLAEAGNTHGLGVGDLNGDGRTDVLTGAGWYEHPAENAWGQVWKFHPDWQMSASIPMLVADIDQDGRNDVLVGEGHDYGLYFWRQTAPASDGKLTFDKQLIDKTFSQPHCLALADLDGDGREEIITGKRYFAHNGGDPGGRDKPLLIAYSFDAKQKSFQKKILEEGHVGTGLQISTGDLNGDGSIDIAVPGKSGTYLLLNPTGRQAGK